MKIFPLKESRDYNKITYSEFRIILMMDCITYGLNRVNLLVVFYLVLGSTVSNLLGEFIKLVKSVKD